MLYRELKAYIELNIRSVADGVRREALTATDCLRQVADDFVGIAELGAGAA